MQVVYVLSLYITPFLYDWRPPVIFHYEIILFSNIGNASFAGFSLLFPVNCQKKISYANNSPKKAYYWRLLSNSVKGL